MNAASNKPARRESTSPDSITRTNLEEIQKLVDKAGGAIEKFVGKAARMRFQRAAVAHWLHSEDDRLRAVTPASYFAAVMDAAADRLVPDGREGWIIVRRGVASWTPSYIGLIKVARRATTLRELSAEVVYAADTFDVDLGSNRKIVHKPYYAMGIPDEDRGEVICAYAGCRVGPTWDYEFRIVERKRLDEIKAMSGDPRDDKPSKVWLKNEAQMQRKHALRMLLKWLELPDEVIEVLAREDERRTRIEQMGAGSGDIVGAPTPADARNASAFQSQIQQAGERQGIADKSEGS